MKRVLFALAAAALAGGALALTACNSDPLKGCSFAALDISPPTKYLQLAVGDSATVGANALSDCAAVGTGVDFALANPSLANLRVVSSNTAMLRGLAVGTTYLRIAPKDYPQNRDSVEIFVIGANP